MEDIDGHAHPRFDLPSRDNPRHDQPSDRVCRPDRPARTPGRRRGLRFGIVNVQTLHTTTAVVVNEHEPLLLADFQALLEAAAPGDGRYRHDDTTVRTVNMTDAERPNGHAHCRALLLPSSACLNVTNGRLRLGQWQRVFFVELDGPRERDLSVLIVGEAGE